MKSSKLLTIPELAKRYAVNRITAWRWIKRGLIPICPGLPATVLLVDEKSLEEFVPPSPGNPNWKKKSER